MSKKKRYTKTYPEQAKQTPTSPKPTTPKPVPQEVEPVSAYSQGFIKLFVLACILGLITTALFITGRVWFGIISWICDIALFMASAASK